MTRITSLFPTPRYHGDYNRPNLGNNSLFAAKAAQSPERLQYEVELESTTGVRERLFPALRPIIPGLDYFADWRPTRGMSGDYIDYFEMNSGNLGLAVGDVCGKDVSAAAVTSSLHSLIRGMRFAHTPSLGVLVCTIDKRFAEVCPDNCYATLFVAEYNPETGRLHYVNAGHEPPFVLRKNGRHFQTIFLESGGPVIGMLRDSTYREGALTLRPGDLLVAYTDGLCETRNPNGEEWGWPRFQETVEACGDETARDIVEGVLQSAENFANGAPPRDDVTLWVGRVQEAVAETPRWRMESVADLVAA